MQLIQKHNRLFLERLATSVQVRDMIGCVTVILSLLSYNELLCCYRKRTSIMTLLRRKQCPVIWPREGNN